MRRRRPSTWISASSLSRSWRAIRRSTASPSTRNSPSSTRSTLNPRRAAGRNTRCSASSPTSLQVASGAPTCTDRNAAQQLASPARRGPARVAREVTSTGTSSPQPLPASRAPRPSAPRPRSTRSAFDSASIRGSARQALVVQLELVLDRREVRLGVGAVQRREVEHVDEQPRALDVREELVAQARALLSALDQAGDVGQDQLALRALERAEHRLERGERVAGDLRRRARHAATAATTCRRSAARRGRRRRAA